MSPNRLLLSLNSLLPADIRVLSLTEMEKSFHPTLDCIEKEYHYWICNSPVQLPHQRFTSWHLHTPLDYASMQQAATLLTGTHDFAAFCNSQKDGYESTIRHISAIELSCAAQRLCISVRGPRFLYRMVRNLVGTLASVGMGKMSLNALTNLLKTGDRTKGGVTAPAHGLTLFQVTYGSRQSNQPIHQGDASQD